MLVMGAEHDGIVSRRQVLDTARAYATAAHFIAGVGPNMMLEPRWRTVADHIIIDWLARRDL